MELPGSGNTKLDVWRPTLSVLKDFLGRSEGPEDIVEHLQASLQLKHRVEIDVNKDVK